MLLIAQQKIEAGFELLTEYTSIKNLNLIGTDSDEFIYNLRTVRPYLYTTLPKIKTYIKAHSAQIPETTINNPPIDLNGDIFIENAYFEANLLKIKPELNIKVGKQPINWASSIILCDNDIGLDSIILNLNIKNFKAELLTGVKKSLLEEDSLSFSGAKIEYNTQRSIYEIMYLIENGGNFIYQNSTYTSFSKTFYGVRYSPKLKNTQVIVEYYIQLGNAISTKEIKLIGDAFAITLKGEGRSRLIGWAEASFRWATATGDKSLTDDIEAFIPSFTKKFSGLNRVGEGFILKANPLDTAPIGKPLEYFSKNATSLTQNYPGIQFFSLNISFTPIAKFMLHTGWLQANLNATGPGTPADKLLGAEYYIGASYKHSKYLELLFLTGQFQPREAYGLGTDRVTKSSFITKLSF